MRKSSSRTLATYLVLLADELVVPLSIPEDGRDPLRRVAVVRDSEMIGLRKVNFIRGVDLKKNYARVFTYVEEVANGACLNQKGQGIRLH